MGNQLRAVLTFIVLLWVIEIVDQLTGRSLDAWGIRPRTLEGLRGIPLAPFLHGGFGHLVANTGPLLVLGLFVIMAGVGEFVEATVLIVLLGGLGTWLIGRGDAVHIGASGVVFGYVSYLIVRGILVRSFAGFTIAVIVAVVYGGLLWGVLPSHRGVSWEAHLSGLVAGVLVAWLRLR